MKLWTIQPEEVYEEINSMGVYHCEEEKSTMKLLELTNEYNWLVEQMKKHIGLPPEGVSYPVWAWYKWSEDRKMPDLRAERWCYGSKGDIYYRMEIEIPDDKVLLSDFDAWAWDVLNRWLISYTEQEHDELHKLYDTLTPREKRKMLVKNWERVLDITPLDNDWTKRGDSIQATFWELRREDIRKVKMFITMGKR